MKAFALAPALALSLLTTNALASTAETVMVKTPRGVMVEVALQIPADLRGKAPVVVIAPGQGYHMNLPILRGLAERLADQGLIAVRFNWNYYSTDPQNGLPSKKYADEIEDMKAVLAFARADARVDADQVILAGKSLGSMVSYQVFTQDPQAKALLLLTPVCTVRYDDNDQLLPAPLPAGSQKYPGLAGLTKPIAMVLGSADPLCSLPMLYDFLKDTKGNVAVDVLGGDHSWNISQGTDPESMRRNAENVAQGVAMGAHWVMLQFGK